MLDPWIFDPAGPVGAGLARDHIVNDQHHRPQGGLLQRATNKALIVGPFLIWERGQELTKSANYLQLKLNCVYLHIVDRVTSLLLHSANFSPIAPRPID